MTLKLIFCVLVLKELFLMTNMTYKYYVITISYYDLVKLNGGLQMF